jgi:hypothetical protein
MPFDLGIEVAPHRVGGLESGHRVEVNLAVVVIRAVQVYQHVLCRNTHD